MKKKVKKKPARMGRPPKPPAEKLSKLVLVRMTAVEFKKIHKEAAEANVSCPGLLMRPWRRKVGTLKGREVVEYLRKNWKNLPEKVQLGIYSLLTYG